MFLFLLTVVLPYLFLSSYAEFFTAIEDLEPLLETRKMVIDNLDFYIKMEEQRILLLKRQWILYKQEHDKSMENVSNYLGNPINAFCLIKSLTTDLDFVKDSIREGTEYIKNESVKYPTPEDLTGAARSLARLQETYKLNVRDLSEGMLNGENYGTQMSAGDCYELGQALYNEKDFKKALAWMTESYRKFLKYEEAYPFKEIDILEYIAFSHYLLGDLQPALEWTYKMLKLEPKYARTLGNVPHFKKAIAEQDAQSKKEQRGDVGDPNQDQVVEEKYQWTVYEHLCRGEIDVSAEISKRLKCWYMSEHHPFLKYAPIKVEQTYIQPDIFIFHEVLSDSEIETIQSLAKPRFKRSVVHGPETGEMTPAHYRISKSGWLNNEDSPVVARLSQRVADMTGLDMETAEELQVANYGIGGYYVPHFDFTQMSDVAQGGATVFTELGLSLFPIKGAAVFWMNLHPSGEGDMATLHAACPVLRGSKWVCSKWIHQGGQELIKPCDLEYQIEGIRRKLPKPVPRTSIQVVAIYPPAELPRT